MRARVPLLLATASLLLAGCGDPPLESSPDSRSADVECCPIQVETSCYQTGGAKMFGMCFTFCDCGPEAWDYQTDRFGCPVAIPDGPPVCATRDAGPQESQDAGVDAGADAGD